MAITCMGGSPVLLLQFGVGLALVVGVVSYPFFLLLSILCYFVKRHRSYNSSDV